VSRWRLPIALGVLAGLSAYVYFFEIKGEEARKKAKDASELVFSVPQDKISGLLLGLHGEKVRLDKAAGAWKIVEPLQAAPDTEAVDRLVGSLLALKITHDLGRQTDLASFNLQTPPATLEMKVSDSKAPPVLTLGDDAPTGGGIYARVGPEGNVVILSGAESLRGTKLFSLRDKTFFKFEPAKLSSLRIVRDKDEVSLVKSDGRWALQAPLRAPAEDSTITDLLFALTRLTVTEFAEEKPSGESQQKQGLRPARIRVLLHGEEWKTDPELMFGAAQAGNLFALHPGTGALVKVSDSIQPKLNSTLADLRRKDLMPMQRYDVGAFHVTGVAPKDLELKRKGDREWDRLAPTPAVLPDDPVDTLLRSLTDLKAQEFLDKPAAKLATYGLDPPQASLEFRKQNEDSAKPSVIQVGRADGHGKVFFKDSQWPSVCLVPEDLWKRAADQVRKVAEERPAAPAPAQTAPGKPAAAKQ
jgi:uncharacterized protein DUF4340